MTIFLVEWLLTFPLLFLYPYQLLLSPMWHVSWPLMFQILLWDFRISSRCLFLTSSFIALNLFFEYRHKMVPEVVIWLVWKHCDDLFDFSDILRTWSCMYEITLLIYANYILTCSISCIVTVYDFSGVLSLVCCPSVSCFMRIFQFDQAGEPGFWLVTATVYIVGMHLPWLYCNTSGMRCLLRGLYYWQGLSHQDISWINVYISFGNLITFLLKLCH